MEPTAPTPEPPPFDPKEFEPPPEDPRDRLRRRLKQIPLLAFILFLGCVASELLFPGVKVTIVNRGDKPMRDVCVSVLKDSEIIPLLSPGAEESLYFRSEGQMPVLIEYTDENNKAIRLKSAEQHFSGLRGKLRLEVKGEEILPEPSAPGANATP